LIDEKCAGCVMPSVEHPRMKRGAFAVQWSRGAVAQAVEFVASRMRRPWRPAPMPPTLLTRAAAMREMDVCG
jgi:hypothetical protein